MTPAAYEFYNAENKIANIPSEIIDQTEKINLMPAYYGGLTNTFSFKGIELDLFVQFVRQRA